MKKRLHFVRVTKVLGAVAVLAGLGLSTSASAQNAGNDVVPTISFLPERSEADGSIVYGSGTMLVRLSNSIFASIHTSGLEPGTVATGWLGIFNDPRYCATSPCTPADLSNPAVHGSLLNFGGRIVGADGVANFAEVRAVGDTTRAQIAGSGLIDPRRAEIHLAVRTHGPASMDPVELSQQLTTFNAGCPPNTCMTVQAARHQP